jgi:alpha-amylase/alpha-mannosidase (GH57 family)
MSDDSHPLPVVLCWHMHQPDYRGPDHSDYQLPWVYLHGIKDYVDMAYHLEVVAGAKAVVNFTPTLLEQIDDYILQIDAWLAEGSRIGDPLLAALSDWELPEDADGRGKLIAACLRANKARLIDRFTPFKELTDLVVQVEKHPLCLNYLNDQFLIDLLVWYHLAWLGESVREHDSRVAQLEHRARHFDRDDCRLLVSIIGEQLASIVPRYRTLAERGQVELTVTPHAHPILPLLLDIQSAREALPDTGLPELAHYPGGEARARWHIEQGLETFERHFGFRPQGCWPAEGGVCDHTLALLEEAGFSWAATGQQVLNHSLKQVAEGDLAPHYVHRPYQLGEGDLRMFFRDDGLSDLIGFTYSSWHADDAVNNLIHHLEQIEAESRKMPERIVSIIMDGENAWEHYPKNGEYFLQALYERLLDHPLLSLTTYSDYLSGHGAGAATEPGKLPHLVPGSWVYGTFSTWIGDPDKNRGWDMLGEAKACFDRVAASGRLDPEQLQKAEVQLATCEGSDWFWWFGDYNPADSVSDFEQLFRRQLSHLYYLLGEQPPAYLSEVFARGSGEPSLGGVMRQSH